MSVFICSDEEKKCILKENGCESYTNIEEFINSNVVDVGYLFLHSTDKSSDFYDEALKLTKYVEENEQVKLVHIGGSEAGEDFKVFVNSLGKGILVENDFYLDNGEDFQFFMENIDDLIQNDVTESALVFYDKLLNIIDTSGVELPILERRKIRRLVDSWQKTTTDLVVLRDNALAVVQEAFSKSSKRLEESQADIDNIKEQLDQLYQKEQAGGLSLAQVKLGQSVGSFAPYRVGVSNTAILVVKEYTPCRYLTSFLLGYIKHLEVKKALLARLLVVVDGKPLTVDRYSSALYRLTQGNYKGSSAMRENLSFTSEPYRELLDETLKRNDAVLVVLDRTYERDSIYKGTVMQVDAVGSVKDVDLFGLEVGNCILPITDVEGSRVILKHILNYPQNVDARYGKYLQMYSDVYAQLDSDLGIDKY